MIISLGIKIDSEIYFTFIIFNQKISRIPIFGHLGCLQLLISINNDVLNILCVNFCPTPN